MFEELQISFVLLLKGSENPIAMKDLQTSSGGFKAEGHPKLNFTLLGPADEFYAH